MMQISNGINHRPGVVILLLCVIRVGINDSWFMWEKVYRGAFGFDDSLSAFIDFERA